MSDQPNHTLEAFADLLAVDERTEGQMALDAILGVGVLLGADCPAAAATLAKLAEAAYPESAPWPWTHPKPDRLDADGATND